MKTHRKIGFGSIWIGIFLSMLIWPGYGTARPNPEEFPSKILYVPTFHSRPFFIKNLRPEQASPVKKVSINEPFFAEVKIITPYEIVIDGKYPGSTMCIIWYEDNTVDFLEIRVTMPRPIPVYEVEVIKGLKSCPENSLIDVIW